MDQYYCARPQDNRNKYFKGKVFVCASYGFFPFTDSVNLLKKNGLNIFDAEKIPTHGGSLRVYSSKKKISPSERMKKIIINEKNESEHIEYINHLFKIFAEKNKKYYEKSYQIITHIIKNIRHYLWMFF